MCLFLLISRPIGPYRAPRLPTATGSTLVSRVAPGSTPTNEWVNFYSQASYYYGQPLPIGAVVRAYNPRGIQAGEFTVTTQGWYGLMPVYRDDPETPEDEGLRPGEEVSFTINGIPARPDGPDDVIWTTNGALKQVNLIVSSVRPTNEWVNFYSQNTTLNGQPVPVGTLVEAFDPQGTKCGETIVNHAGWYGLLLCYRDDPETPEDEGAVPGDTIAFRVAGSPAAASGPDTPQWTSNGDIREVDLAARTVPCYDFLPPAGVGAEDVQLVAAHWREHPGHPGWDPRFDLNGDGQVTVADILRVAAAWGRTCK